jgi:hypothetical protein
LLLSLTEVSDKFVESDHPRGKPGNAGQFAPAGGGGGSKSEGKEGGNKSAKLSEIAKREPPASLPEDHAKYFNVPENAKVVPLDKIVPSKPEQQSQKEAERGAKYMAAAANGEIEKRGPVTVSEQPDGSFKIIDGNGTLTVAKNYGWKGLPVVVEKAKPNFRDSLARETSGSTTQPVESLDELYERAKKAEGGFKDTVEVAAKKHGAVVKYTPPEHAEPGSILKSRKSSERKLSSELGGDSTQLRDVLRATVGCSTVVKTRQAAADFIGQHSDSIVRVKDRYADPLKGGYRDILINYRTPDGIVAEVQFNSKQMIKTKNEAAHKLYEKARELKNPTPEDLAKLEDQMSQLYDVAYQADGNGKGWKSPKQAKDSVDSGDQVLRRYKLSQPDGPEFEAVIAKQDGEVFVLTNRTGSWAPDEELSYADLIMPEQALSDWDVTPMEPGEIPTIDASPKPLAFDVESEGDDTSSLRALDRRHVDTNDIEYFTSESLGPNRERTPEGFLICYDVPVARVGEMVYGPGEVPPELGVGRDGRIRVTRSAAEVFDPSSMASLNGKPVTDDHPPVDVDPKNWAFYTKGVVVNPRRGTGEHRDFLVVDVIVYDGPLIEEITADERGEPAKREVSCGYNPEYLQLLDPITREPIPGRGEQIRIRYNHLAMVKAGRCGPMCAVGDRKTVDQNIDTFCTPERVRRLQRLIQRFG